MKKRRSRLDPPGAALVVSRDISCLVLPIFRPISGVVYSMPVCYAENESSHKTPLKSLKRKVFILNQTNEALAIWDALRPMIQQEINKQTDSCVRAKKMLVTYPPDGVQIGVAEPFGETFFIPYSSSLASAKTGDAVWVWWFFGNASTMIALSTGVGQLSNPYAVVPQAPRFYVNNHNMLVMSYPNEGFSSDALSIVDGELLLNDPGDFADGDYALDENMNLVLTY